MASVALCSCGIVPHGTTGTNGGTYTEFILDTFCSVTVNSSDENSGEIAEYAFSAAREIQKSTDFYDPDSNVSNFNSAAAGEAVSLDDYTFDIVRLALEVSEKSGGAFDITIAPVSELWDFKSDNPKPPDDKLIKEALSLVNCKNLVLDENARTLTKLKSGVKIDLGSCAKGYACEKIQQLIADKYPNAYVLIDFGGNIGVCGNNPKHKDGHTTIGIQEPFKDTGVYNRTADIYSGQSAVTSGTYQRHFYFGGKNYHHLLDPKTGYPAEPGIDSVTIISNSSCLSDCLSTACFILGEENGAALAEAYGAKAIWIKGE